MEKAIIGKKIGMTQIFDADGKVIPVTVIEAGPCTVVQKKTEEKDGYNAVQLGYGDVAERKLTKPELGHLKKAGDARKKTLKEFKLAKAAEMNVGDEVKVDVFAEGDRVDVTGISKGHGYQGVIKRHGAHRLKETHGSGPVVRHAGSMGANSSPSKIFKGKIGAGQMGDEQVTVQNLDVVKVDPEYNLIAVRGAIPGPKGGIVFVKSTVKTHVEKKGPAAGTLRRLIALYALPEAAQRLRCTALLFELLAALTEETVRAAVLEEGSLSPSGILYARRACRYIAAHLSEKITMAALAAELGISTSYLSALFKAYTGRSVVDYVNARRVERVRELLATKGGPLREAGESVGLADENYVGRLFKRYTGQSVRDFQRQCQARNAESGPESPENE